jgi:hypothetical protein
VMMTLVKFVCPVTCITGNRMAKVRKTIALYRSIFIVLLWLLFFKAADSQ